MYILIPINKAANTAYLQLQRTEFAMQVQDHSFNVSDFVKHTKVNEDLTVSEYGICGSNSFTENELSEADLLGGLVFQTAEDLNNWKYEFGFTEWDDTTEQFNVNTYEETI